MPFTDDDSAESDHLRRLQEEVQALHLLRHSAGYALLQREAESQMQTATALLAACDPRDAAKVAELQARVRTWALLAPGVRTPDGEPADLAYRMAQSREAERDEARAQRERVQEGEGVTPPERTGGRLAI